MKTGIELIADERQKQIEVKGYDSAFVTANPNYYANGQLADAAILCLTGNASITLRESWPFEDLDRLEWHEGIKSLTVAGALIAAEIDRLQALEG